MPLTTPRELALLQDLQAALRAIQTADGYGWDVTPSSVVLDADNIFDKSGSQLPFFIVEGSDEGEREFLPAGDLGDEFVAVITARVDAKGLDPDRRNTIGWHLHADIEKALTLDIERGGLAADTRLRKPQIFTSVSGDQPVIVVEKAVMKLFRDYGDPA